MVCLSSGESVLCLDGGGIRGLVQLEILSHIEDLTHRRIVNLFDWIVGTSTGGILALGLVYGVCCLSKGWDYKIVFKFSGGGELRLGGNLGGGGGGVGGDNSRATPLCMKPYCWVLCIVCVCGYSLLFFLVYILSSLFLFCCSVIHT